MKLNKLMCVFIKNEDESKDYLTYHVEEFNNQLHIDIQPTQDFCVKGLRFYFEPEVIYQGKMLANGYQTWTETKYLGEHDRIKKLMPLLRLFSMDKYGDYHFYKGSGAKGFIYSHEFTQFKHEDRYRIVGSFNSKQYCTVIERDYCANTFSVYVDLEGLNLLKGKSYRIIDLFYQDGMNSNQLWQTYFQKIQGERTNKDSCTGWTSWYYYYTQIDEERINQNIKALSEAGLPMKVFQIDDGYQKAVGDWLHTNDKFEHGMKVIADKIKRNGMLPGIWLAPFICARDSFIYKEKQEWIVKNNKGKPLIVGWNPQWNGYFYALDIYNKACHEYIQKVFRTIFDSWGYGMVKIDFLYAVNVVPRNNKTRAQIMYDAIQLINEEVGDRLVLGCGIPIGSAMKQVDYCRIGADVAAYWEDRSLTFFGYRERISTKASLFNTFNRHCMNGNVFGNDPDVFMLRDKDNKLNKDEKFTLFFVNHLLGNLVFFSDDVRLYDDETLKLLNKAYPIIKPKHIVIQQDNDVFTMQFSIKRRQYIAYTNMNDQDKQATLPPGIFCSNDMKIDKGNKAIQLPPHATVCYYELEQNEQQLWVVSDASFYPGAEIIDYDYYNGAMTINSEDTVNRQHRYYVVSVNGLNLQTVNERLVSKMPNAILNVWKTNS